MELEPGNPDFKPRIDRRPHMPEPPPVSIVAVEDVNLPAPAGIETELDDFYIAVLGFEREGADEGELIYRADNVRLRFDVYEPPVQHPDLRPTMVLVPSLNLTRGLIIDRDLEHTWQRGVSAGSDSILLQDPAGNWVEIAERRQVG